MRILLIGSTSELGTKILEELELKSHDEVYFVGRKPPSDNSSIACKTHYYNSDFSINSLDQFDQFINSLAEIDMILFALGYLPDENQELDYKVVNQTSLLNVTVSLNVISIICNKLVSQNFGHLVYLSSVAAARPRVSNFTYGATKKTIEFFLLGMQLKHEEMKITILRFGYVFTKMSMNFKPAPFALTCKEAAKLAVRAIPKQEKIVYVPKVLEIVLFVVTRLPEKIFLWISDKVEVRR